MLNYTPFRAASNWVGPASNRGRPRELCEEAGLVAKQVDEVAKHPSS